MKLHEQAYSLAKEGKTNTEIFGILQLSPGQVLKLCISDTPLLYAIIQGRSAYMEPFVNLLADEAKELVHRDAPARNFKALQTFLERYDRENRALGVAYDMGMIASAPAPRDNQLRGAELTKALREAS